VTWINLDDKMPDHPKILALSDGAFRLHVSAIAYCNRYQTDGVVPAEAVPKLMPRFRPSYLTELVGDSANGNRGLWLQRSNAYELHDYLDWNKSKAEIAWRGDRLSQIRSEAGKKGAAARWQKP
jgi:hypothetical protein